MMLPLLLSMLLGLCEDACFETIEFENVSFVTIRVKINMFVSKDVTTLPLIIITTTITSGSINSVMIKLIDTTSQITGITASISRCHRLRL